MMLSPASITSLSGSGLTVRIGGGAEKREVTSAVWHLDIYLALLHSVSPIKDDHGVKVCSSPLCIGPGSTH